MSLLHCMHNLVWVRAFSPPFLFLRSLGMWIRYMSGIANKTVEGERFRKGLNQKREFKK